MENKRKNYLIIFSFTMIGFLYQCPFVCAVTYGLDCGSGKNLIIANSNTTERKPTVNGVDVYIPSTSMTQIYCAGSTTVIDSDSVPVTVGLLPNAYTDEKNDWSKYFSFLAGLMCAAAFAGAASRKW